MSTAEPNETAASKRRPILLGSAAVAIAGILGLAWWLGFLTAEPEPVSITESVAAVSSESETEQTAATDAAEVTEADAAETAESAAEPVAQSVGSFSIAGDWSVVSSDATFIGYRADSQVGEAVGRSPGVSGTLSATDSEITAVSIVGDMTLLESDSSVRDDHLGDDGLETNVFPTSTFTLTEPISISEIPDVGVEQSFTATGELTIKEITQPVTIELQAVIVDDQFVVAGDSQISLEDFDATISSTTEAVMEFSLVFAR